MLVENLLASGHHMRRSDTAIFWFSGERNGRGAPNHNGGKGQQVVAGNRRECVTERSCDREREENHDFPAPKQIADVEEGEWTGVARGKKKGRVTRVGSADLRTKERYARAKWETKGRGKMSPPPYDFSFHPLFFVFTIRSCYRIAAASWRQPRSRQRRRQPLLSRRRACDGVGSVVVDLAPFERSPPQRAARRQLVGGSPQREVGRRTRVRCR